MSLRLTHLSQFLDHGHDAVIDVRSPSEFAEDRVPGAVAWNLFDIDAKFADVEPLERCVAYLDEVGLRNAA